MTAEQPQSTTPWYEVRLLQRNHLWHTLNVSTTLEGAERQAVSYRTAFPDAEIGVFKVVELVKGLVP